MSSVRAGQSECRCCGVELFYQFCRGRLRIAASWAAILLLGHFKQLGMGVQSKTGRSIAKTLLLRSTGRRGQKAANAPSAVVAPSSSSIRLNMQLMQFSQSPAANQEEVCWLFGGCFPVFYILCFFSYSPSCAYLLL